jgi:hypothetical protein
MVCPRRAPGFPPRRCFRVFVRRLGEPNSFQLTRRRYIGCGLEEIVRVGSIRPNYRQLIDSSSSFWYP